MREKGPWQRTLSEGAPSLKSLGGASCWRGGIGKKKSMGGGASWKPAAELNETTPLPINLIRREGERSYSAARLSLKGATISIRKRKEVKKRCSGRCRARGGKEKLARAAALREKEKSSLPLRSGIAKAARHGREKGGLCLEEG